MKDDLVVHPRRWVGSTQDEARGLLAEGTGAPFAVVTCDQRRGRGRLSREWTMPDGGGLAETVVHHSLLPPDRRGWYSAVVGLGVLATLRDVVAPSGDEGAFGLKWPNDVLAADGRKLAGILLEADGGLDAQGRGTVLAGVGLNLRGPVRDGDGAAVPGAAWLGGPGGERVAADGIGEGTGRSCGRPEDEDPASPVTVLGSALAARIAPRLAVSIQHELNVLDEAGGDALNTGQAERYSMACVTLGRVVRVDPLGLRPAPDGGAASADGEDSWQGIARTVDGEGRLVVEDGEGRSVPLAVGDVWHLRTAAPDGVDGGHGPWEQEKYS